MSPAPVLTVIVPTYRRPELLRRALRSITAQACNGFQLVVRVYDNASGDDTEEVVRAAGAGGVTVDYVRRPQNIGAVRNFSGAIKDTRSDFFAIISDDDVLLPGALTENMAGLLAHPDAVAWNGKVLSGSESRLTGIRPAPQWPVGVTDGLRALCLISRNIRPETTGMVFRTATVDAGFCVDDNTFMAQDLLWLASAARQGAIGFSPQPTAILYVHEQSLSSGGGAAQAVGVLFPSIPRLCEMIEGWQLPAAARARVIGQFQQGYGRHGLLLVLYRAALAGDADGIGAVQQAAGGHSWLADVSARVGWARRASRRQLRLALLSEQLRHGNWRQKLGVVWWNQFHWGRYREFLSA